MEACIMLVFILYKSTCIDNEYLADVSIEKGTGVVGKEFFERILPQIATYPPAGIPSDVDSGKCKPVATGAQHSVSGTINIKHLVTAKRQTIGSQAAACLYVAKVTIKSGHKVQKN